MSRRIRLLLGAALVLFAAAIPAAASTVQVDLELALAVDVSSSIDREEALLQREGYVAALRHPDVIHAIENGPLGRIAVTYYEWAGDGNLRVVADWTVIHDADSAAAFAEKIAGSSLWTAPRTSIAAAIDFGVDGFRANGHIGNRQVIDVSGDGPNNGMREVTAARDRAIYRGVTINGLAVVNGRADANGNLPLPDLDLYYRDCVVGGFGSFVAVANSFHEFGVAIRRKLISEIAGVMPVEEPRVVPAALSRICDYGLLSWKEIFIH